MAQAGAIARADEFESGPEGESRRLKVLRQWPRASASALIVAAGLILAWHTWARWGDIQMDCGRELYVPAQILRGKLLYRDLWYPFGPLAPYLEALLLGLFGQHFYVLYFFGLASAIGSALALFGIGTLIESRAVGLSAALALLIHGFRPTIFNYVFPYSYAATLGMLLSLLCAWFALRHILGGGPRDLTLAGLAAGFALLCKQEFGIACFAMLAFVVLMDAVVERSGRVLLVRIAACLPGALICAAIFGWFFLKLGAGFVLFDNLQAVPGSNFMRTYGSHWAAIGLRPTLAESFILVLSCVVALGLWATLARAREMLGRWWFGAAVGVLAAGLMASREFAPPVNSVASVFLIFPSGIFFIGCGFLLYAMYELRQDRRDRRWRAEAALGVFALLLAFRFLTRLALYGYSIFYDGPLFVVFLIVLARWIGRVVALERRRALINSIMAAEVVLLAATAIPGQSARTAPLATSWGTIYLQPAEAQPASQILDFLLEQKHMGRKVALLPELPMLYALSGTEAPSRWYTLTPGVMMPAEQKGYIADLTRVAPDFIVLTNRDTSEYGASYFGIDYDRATYRWIEANYHVVGQFGDFQRNGSRFLSALLYQRVSRLDSRASK